MKLLFSRVVIVSLFLMSITHFSMRGLQAAVIASGDVTPSDPTSWTISTNPTIGYTGTGGLDINGGTDVLSDRVYIGRDTTGKGTVTLDGAGSTWVVDDYLFVGYEGEATLDISGGATLTNHSAQVANNASSKALVKIRGAGSTWSHEDHSGFGIGESKLEISDGGQLIGRSFYFRGPSTAVDATVVGDGSLIQTSD